MLFPVARVPDLPSLRDSVKAAFADVYTLICSIGWGWCSVSRCLILQPEIVTWPDTGVTWNGHRLMIMVCDDTW
jgi:hypothetical protein